MSYLLDTCVISELISRQQNERVVEWIDGVDEQLIYLSVITVGEIKRSIEKLPESRKKGSLHKWLHEDLLLRFDNRILAIDLAIMLNWGTLVAQLERQGRILPAIDSLIAALALRHDLRLVTRNEKDFVGTGVEIVNPWTS